MESFEQKFDALDSPQAAENIGAKFCDMYTFRPGRFDWKQHCINTYNHTILTNIALYLTFGKRLALDLYMIHRKCEEIQGEPYECMMEFSLAVSLCTMYIKSVSHKLHRCIDTIYENNITMSSQPMMCENEEIAKLQPCLKQREMVQLLFNASQYISEEYEYIFYGYCIPVLTVLTLICNGLQVAAFFMERFFSSAHVLLIGMSFFDILTLLVQTPYLFYYLTLGNYIHVVPYVHCVGFTTIVETIVPMCHGIRIWLMVGFSFYRYAWYKHPEVCNKLMMYRRMALFYIFVATLATGLMFFPAFLDLTDFVKIQVYSSSQGEITTTWQRPISKATGILKVRSASTYLLRSSFLYLVPCIVVIYLGVSAVKTKHDRKRKTTEISRDIDRNGPLYSSGQRIKFIRITVIIIVIFVLTEFPNAILSSALFALQMSEANAETVAHIRLPIFIANVITVLSGLSNFCIYLIESKTFRSRLMNIFSVGHCKIQKHARTGNETMEIHRQRSTKANRYIGQDNYEISN